LLEHEERGTHRDLIVLAIDGIPHSLAIETWPNAQILKMRSVFPTTSSTAWLSSLTGAEVAHHGIPGVVFKDSSGELINIFEYQGELNSPATVNMFSDATAFGYVPISIVGDLEPLDCAWRRLLLNHSEWVREAQFYTALPPLDARQVSERVRSAISHCLETAKYNAPRLVWCFIDADQYIHKRGYDDEMIRFLELIDDVASELTRRDAIVIAHSDHGLTRTNHNVDLQRLLEDLGNRYQCTLGGAGRTRWFYTQRGNKGKLFAALEKSLASTVRLCWAEEVFRSESLARDRVGEIVLIAEGEEFVTFSGYRFDHGSNTESELNVPFAQWM
jgi:hypothetical protein